LQGLSAGVRGTGSSNPSPSSGESGANRLSGAHLAFLRLTPRVGPQWTRLWIIFGLPRRFRASIDSRPNRRARPGRRKLITPGADRSVYSDQGSRRPRHRFSSLAANRRGLAGASDAHLIRAPGGDLRLATAPAQLHSIDCDGSGWFAASYAPDVVTVWRRAADFANRILKGANPAEMLWLSAIEDAPLPSSLASEPQRSSCWRGRCPRPGDQRQDFLEHLPRDCDLGYLERDVAAMADDLSTDLDRLLAQVVSDHGFAGLGIAFA
jgi:hypothetical protein